mmetsp:Transcript_29334/g.77826  ORF Transcript_29334/g.77826 Transcript_29334/m.77826 type:complete len:600 (-) Transcript_29334:140-1939(-)
MFVALILLATESVYLKGEPVTLYANKVGPFANPSEVYAFYSLPYCAPNEIVMKREDLGPLLKGDRATKTNYGISFRQDVDWKSLCKKKLNEKELDGFKRAIVDDYYFEMMLDDLPIWGYVGELETKSIDADHRAHYYLFTHLDFSIAANGPNVIEVNVSADPLQRVDLGASSNEIEFSYSVRWMNSSVPHGDRMNRYAQYSFLPQAFEIHWLSIINSFVLVLLLTGFLSIILMRVLKNDFTRYASAEEEEEEEETGWKLLHGDVFRLPPKVSVFCAWVGIGVQLFALVLFLLILAIMNIFYPGNRGAMYTAAIVLYALTAGFAGFVSAHLYCRLIGTEIGRWAFNLVLSGTLFPVPLFLMFSFLNTVAIAYNSQTALPIGTILVIICIWALITLPLTVIGGILGRNLAKGKDMCVPCRTSRIPREIPPIPWYRQGPCQVFMAGFLPFSAIYIELHYIFASVWGHKLYTLYGVLFIAFGMLIVVTSFITVALTYFQLAIEDHRFPECLTPPQRGCRPNLLFNYRWWWRSFFSGGSTGFFLFAYCFFYYFERSAMFGFMQTSFFFGYMLLAAYAAFLMLGTIGFMSSLCFVLRIYRAIKCD